MESEAISHQTFSVRAVRSTTVFEQKLQASLVLFAQARDALLAELKDDIKDGRNFVGFVVKAMQSIKHLELKQYERQDMVVDLVQSVVASMSIPEDEKATLRRHYPTIVPLVNIFTASAKGYLMLVHEVAEEVEEAKVAIHGCFKRASKTKAALKAPVSAAVTEPTPIDMEATVLDIYHTISSAISQKQLNVGTLMAVGTSVMQIVEQYPQLTGPQKKQAVLDVMHRLVNNSSLSDNDKSILSLMIDSVVSSAINLIVSAANGEIELVNKLVAKVKTSCGC